MDSASFVEHIQGTQITAQLSPDDRNNHFKDAKEDFRDFRDVKMRKILLVMKRGIYLSIAQMGSYTTHCCTTFFFLNIYFRHNPYSHIYIYLIFM